MIPLNSLACQHQFPRLPITLDSRKAGPGVIFIASRGATPNSKDGHDFIEQAISNHCSGLIIERQNLEIPSQIPVWLSQNSRITAAQLAEQVAGHPSRDLNLCGVTGTNGKTTVTFLLASMAQAFGRKSGVIGTLGSGALGHLNYTGLTTPEAEYLSVQLAAFKKQGFQQIAIEVSSHALATHRVDGLIFKAVAFSNLSQDHLDFHGNLENYLKVKTRLWRELLPENGVAILPKIPSLEKRDRGGILYLYWGYSPQVDIQASEIKLSPQGTEFQLRIQNHSIPIKTPLLGRFNIDNILCA